MLSPDQINSALDHVLRGQPDAFLPLVREYSPGLRAYLTSQLFHLDEVDDLAQETFITAYRSLNRFQRGQDFGAWLRGIARNKLLRFFEQTHCQSSRLERFRHEAAELLHGELDAAASDTKSEQLQAMLSCITKLPERLRHVVRTLLDGGKAAALASELKTSPAAIYQLQYRALGLLRECITREIAHEH
jgi:RNA polymerase sigma-70 factor (ECF subfamily)